jgi:hypothetical protein
VLVLDLIGPENVDDDENQGRADGFPRYRSRPRSRPAPCGVLSPMTTLAPLRPKRVPSATGTDAAIGNDRDYTCEVELTIGEAKGEATI